MSSTTPPSAQKSKAVSNTVLSPLSPADQRLFNLRWQRSFDDLMKPLKAIYGALLGFENFCSDLQSLLLRQWTVRPSALKDLDLARDLNPDWFLSEKMVGYVFYIDRFAGDLKGVHKHLDYLDELCANYIHFMPCLKPRPGDSDGGYSVMDYRSIDPKLGTMNDFEQVTAAMRERGMSACVDLVLNHTAKEHEWAEKAKAGNKKYQDYYWMFDTDEIPTQYEKTLVEIFPAHAPGSFTHYPTFGKWVWTTFNEHQWDLNWANPDVFLEIVDIMLNLANKGAEILRLDAVAFMWKRLGTNCQNQPEVHDLLQALRAATRIAAPALIHKAEAIVSPRDLVPYLGTGSHTGREANIAYHNNLMVQYWSSLASRDTRLMTRTLATHFPENFRNATWGTYIRCHDDIGWAITDEDAGAIPHFSAHGHRNFLADFYSGNFAGSYAVGDVFQQNEATGDRRNSGAFASLAGLETALWNNDVGAIHLSISRILMGNALIAAFGGIPLLYMGDELGLTNDHEFGRDPAHAHDNRWMHRPMMDWKRAAALRNSSEPFALIYKGVQHIMTRRKAIPAFSGVHPTQILDVDHAQLFAFKRCGDAQTVTCVYNFSESVQSVALKKLNGSNDFQSYDILSEAHLGSSDGMVHLMPYGCLWLV
jgi:amylosucrase